MAKVFECSHGGVVCNARITGATDAEVLERAVAHAREKHGVDLAQADTLARYAQSLIRDEGQDDRAAGAESETAAAGAASER